MKKNALFLALLILGGMVMPNVATAQAQEICFLLMLYPVRVEMCHDGTVVDVVDTEFGPENVYEIHSINYRNETSMPWRLSASDYQASSWQSTIAAAGEGEVNIPTPQRYRTYELSFKMTLIRN